MIFGKNFYEITLARITEMHSCTYSDMILFAILMHLSKLSLEINLSAITSNLSLKFSARTISKLQASLQTYERKSPIYVVRIN